MAKWKAPRWRRPHAAKPRKTGPRPGYISSDLIDWTDEMRRTLIFCRRQLKLPLRITAAVVGVSFEALYRKMKFWRMPLRLKQYATSKVRDDYIERYKVKNYTQAYKPGQAGEE